MRFSWCAHRCLLASVIAFALGEPGAVRAGEGLPSELAIAPKTVALRGGLARQQFLASGLVGNRQLDLTSRVEWRSEDPQIVAIGADGVAHARGDGATAIVASLGGSRARALVRASGTGERAKPTFERDVLPILTRAGCNAGACHGKARGQNGFALSLLGFDARMDYGAITQEARGRRVFPAAPAESLLLQKATARVPHGGGRRLEPEGEAEELLRRWIALGMPRDPEGSPRLERLSVTPSERTMNNGAAHRVVVTAHYSDGSTRDVTHLAAYQSNESAIASVTPDGVIQTGPIPGEAAITARFRDKFTTCAITIPLPGDVPAALYASLPRANFIDGLVWAKLERLGITPSEACSDATFLRRASLDAIGRIPTPAEVRAFLADPSPEKRPMLVDRLLARPEYADFWANKWLDLLRPNPYRVGIKAVLGLDAWVRDAFRRNVPYDEFVRALVTAQGSTYRNGAVVLFRDRREPEEIAPIVSQLFLGIRLECAKCHHHPFEAWGQEDFYGFAAYFARLGRKGTGLSPPISGSEEIVFTAKRGSVKHPLTGEMLAPKPLLGKAPKTDDPDEDPRADLARWMTGSENPYFAEVIVNRVWADLMVRGIVEPVDDLRATNPPSNPALLKALADDFRRDGYHLKHLIRTIMTSYVYGLSSEPDERNIPDTRNYSRRYRQRLRAEVLLDAIGDVTGVPDRFSAAPAGTRATAIWTHRTPSDFLDAFGRPDPNQDPPCERTSDTSVVQVLHLMNAPKLHEKVTSDSGRIAKLVAGGNSADPVVEELYLLAYNRFPSEEERSIGRDVFAKPGTTAREAAEDLLWALMNSAEFVYKD